MVAGPACLEGRTHMHLWPLPVGLAYFPVLSTRWGYSDDVHEGHLRKSREIKYVFSGAGYRNGLLGLYSTDVVQFSLCISCHS